MDQCGGQQQQQSSDTTPSQSPTPTLVLRPEVKTGEEASRKATEVETGATATGPPTDVRRQSDPDDDNSAPVVDELSKLSLLQQARARGGGSLDAAHPTGATDREDMSKTAPPTLATTPESQNGDEIPTTFGAPDSEVTAEKQEDNTSQTSECSPGLEGRPTSAFRSSTEEAKTEDRSATLDPGTEELLITPSGLSSDSSPGRVSGAIRKVRTEEVESTASEEQPMTSVSSRSDGLVEGCSSAMTDHDAEELPNTYSSLSPVQPSKMSSKQPSRPTSGATAEFFSAPALPSEGSSRPNSGLPNSSPVAASTVSSAGSSSGIKFPDRKDWLRLNVGGKIFLTTKQTLTERGESFFSALIRHHQDIGDLDIWGKDKNPILIDRDPTHFQYILQYLRSGESGVVLTKDVPEEAVLVEAGFYCLTPLVVELERRIRIRDTPPPSPADSLQRIYRVMECDSTRHLNDTLKSLPDGWHSEMIAALNTRHDANGLPVQPYVVILTRLEDRWRDSADVVETKALKVLTGVGAVLPQNRQ